MWLEGNLTEDPVVKGPDHAELMLDLNMQDDRHRNERANTVVFNDTQSSHDNQM